MTILLELVRLMKPRITVMSLITAMTGLSLAPGPAPPTLVASTFLGILLLVGSANTLNMYWERDIDKKMKRTQNRPLPAGRLAPPTALWFGLAQSLAALPLLAFGTNLLTVALGGFALIVYVCVYTPLKQHTTLSLLVGAVPGAMPPLLGWTAATSRIDVAGLALFGVLFLWQVPHFLAIALLRQDEYTGAGLKVLPAVRGIQATKDRILIYLLMQVCVTLALVPAGLGGTGYLVGAGLLGAFMLGWAVYGWRRPVGDRWARGFFFATLVYLPTLFGLLFV